MNFHDMPELRWTYSYPVVVGLTVLGCILLYRKLRRDRWL
jgi:magnesium transporter